MSLEKRRLPWQLPILAKRGTKIVYTEAELKLAIGEIAAENNSSVALAQGFGAEIVLASHIEVTAPITIPFNCPGLTIRGNGFCAITAASTLSSLWVVRAPVFTFKDVLVYADTATPTKVFSKILEIGEWLGGLPPNRIVVENCFLYTDQLIDDNTYILDYFRVDNCNFIHNSAPNATPMVRAQMRYWKVRGNNWDNTSFLTTRANSERNAIIGNHAAGSAIDTSVGNGNNTIIGNTQLVITATHAGDISAGLNSA